MTAHSLYISIITVIVSLIAGEVFFRIAKWYPARLKEKLCISAREILNITKDAQALSPDIPKASALFAKLSHQKLILKLITAIMYLVVIQHYGLGIISILTLVFVSVLLVLSVIDLHEHILPDELTLGLLWLGLLVNSFGVFISLNEAVLGVIVGFSVFWLIHHACKIIYKKDGLGYGDCKLLAAIGAWVGIQHILLVILLSSLLCILHAVVLMIFKKYQKSQVIPYGPSLAVAGFVVLLFGL
ncbi:MAG: hypothetical protein COB50_00150 [Thiotrichales bacterium]|nr:MAG: hypothetical protein COB50_00150 [Thiotrichales bacterium]